MRGLVYVCHIRSSNIRNDERRLEKMFVLWQDRFEIKWDMLPENMHMACRNEHDGRIPEGRCVV